MIAKVPPSSPPAKRPVHPTEVRRPTTQGRPEGAGVGHGVLVVDDDPEVRTLLDRVLGAQGFTVWLAANGYEALKAYQIHRDEIDLVLLDVRMPILDGPQTLAALLQLAPHLRCCFLTGDPGHYTEEELRDRGAMSILSKPFRVDDLATTLRELACASAVPPSSPGPKGRQGASAAEVGMVTEWQLPDEPE
jgi:CheY-like chemotaxis protein